MSGCAIVVGASSGMGLELARQLAQSGWKVAAVARRIDKLNALAAEFEPGQVIAASHDVTDFSEVPDLFQTLTQKLGGFDLIIYASGVMPSVQEDEFNFEKDKAMVDVNLLGAIAWLNIAAARFQLTGHGTIVGIGSVAGDRGRYGQPVYNTTKAALVTYLEALRNRLSRYGVKVVTIKPGPTQTEMTAELGLKGAPTAAEAATMILSKIDKNGEHYLSVKHRLIFFVIRHFPSAIFRKLRV